MQSPVFYQYLGTVESVKHACFKSIYLEVHAAHIKQICKTNMLENKHGTSRCDDVQIEYRARVCWVFNPAYKKNRGVYSNNILRIFKQYVKALIYPALSLYLYTPSTLVRLV